MHDICILVGICSKKNPKRFVFVVTMKSLIIKGICIYLHYVFTFIADSKYLPSKSFLNNFFVLKIVVWNIQENLEKYVIKVLKRGLCQMYLQTEVFDKVSSVDKANFHHNSIQFNSQRQTVFTNLSNYLIYTQHV